MTGLRYYAFVYPRYKRMLGGLGERTRIQPPLKITGGSHIFVGARVRIEDSAWLAAEPLVAADGCRLEIGDETYIGHFSHIYATRSVTIGKKVLVANKIYISDNTHSYEDVRLPVMDQPVRQLRDVKIGDGAWLGENVCIVGASVGKGSVVGAGSVVLSDIPDYSVAVGAPARVIKRFCFDTNRWRKIGHDGTFND